MILCEGGRKGRAMFVSLITIKVLMALSILTCVGFTHTADLQWQELLNSTHAVTQTDINSSIEIS